MVHLSLLAGTGRGTIFSRWFSYRSSSLTSLYMLTFLYFAFSTPSVFALHLSSSLIPEIPAIDREQLSVIDREQSPVIDRQWCYLTNNGVYLANNGVTLKNGAV